MINQGVYYSTVLYIISALIQRNCEISISPFATTITLLDPSFLASFWHKYWIQPGQTHTGKKHPTQSIG